MTSSPAPRPDTSLAEALLIHAGIQAVAERCDGAVTLDMKGFDGQDTHYGRRIAAVAFESLTEDDKAEEARIALKYRQQILTYTGTDVSQFDSVLAAQGVGTNYASRENARRYERAARDAAKHEVVKNQRRCVLQADGQVALSWADRGDPDFKALVEGVRGLPGRRWTGSVNAVFASPELLAFCDAWGIETPADVIATVEAAVAAKANAAPVYNVGVLGGSQGKRLWIKADYDADRVADARNLPGRRWNGGDKMDEVDASPAVLAFAERWNLTISPKAQAAINDAGEEAADAAAPDAAETRKLNRESLLSLASRAGSAADLPAEFITLVNRAIGA